MMTAWPVEASRALGREPRRRERGRRMRRGALRAAAALLGWGCADDPTPVVPPGPPADVQAGSATTREGTVGGAVAEPLVVRVVDADGRAVPNVPVRWQVQDGAGQVAPPEVVTDAQGDARTTWTLGRTAGLQRLTAVATTTRGADSVTFSAQAAVGAPARVRLVAEGPAVAVGDSLPVTTTAVDAFGNASTAARVLTVADTAVLGVEAGGWLRGRRAGATYVYARVAPGTGTPGLVDSVRVRVYEPFRGFAVAPGAYFTCALQSADSLAFCWGDARRTGVSYRPRPLPLATGVRFRSLAAGLDGVCGLSTDGAAWCWGAYGQALDETATPPLVVPRPVPGGRRFASLTVGQAHRCGVSLEGRAYCWGSSSFAVLGIGPVPLTERGFGSEVPEPSPVLAPERDGGSATTAPFLVSAIAAGYQHTCAIAREDSGATNGAALIAGPAYCWGRSGAALGTGATEGTGYVFAPQLVRGGRRFVRLSAGRYTTCGVAADARVYCWGSGIPGAATISRADEPTRAFTDRAFVDVKVTTAVVCALTADGTVLCDGANDYGELGIGVVGPVATQPATVPGGPYAAIEVARNFSLLNEGQAQVCGIAGGIAGGVVRCWGANNFGEVGSALTSEESQAACGRPGYCVPRPMAVSAPARAGGGP